MIIHRATWVDHRLVAACGATGNLVTSDTLHNCPACAAVEPHPIVALWRAMSGAAVEAVAQGEPKANGKGGES